MKRVICLLLVACFMIAALVSCGNDAGEGDGSGDGSGANGSAAETKETDIYGQVKFESAVPDNPEMEVTELTVAYRDSENYSREWFSAEGATDELSEVITIRNDTVDKKIGTTINYQPMGDSLYDNCLAAYREQIAGEITNNTHNYDIVATYAYAGADLEIRDCLANLANKEVFPYFDFSLPCWNQTVVKTTTVNNKLFYITGDLNLSTFDATVVTFVNKELYTSLKEANDPADIQDVAIEGKWTYDEMYKWSSRYQDTDGDGANGCADVHGISASYGSIPLDAFPYAWDLQYVKDNNGTHSYDIVGNAKINDAFTKISNLLNGQVNAGVINGDNASNCTLSGARSEPIIHFVNNKAVFTMHKLYATAEDNAAMVAMEAEFGLLPVPKYDAAQANYGTSAHDSYTLMVAINHDATEQGTYGKAISAWLQLSTEASYTDVRGYYINRIVKPSYFGLDDESGTVTKSIKIFNTIADNVEFDFITVYAPQANKLLNTCWRDAVMDGSTAEAAYTADQATFDNDLAALDAWLAG